ncbi:MAG TPA: phosphate ABC transporter substrate-binding protein PstS [Pseudolabrys sp.]|nr:phosphate ABC transporter substrate-binding protein PstS [Pseudolabrys sp.]
MKHWTAFAAAGVVALALHAPASAAEITGAGSTFVYPILAKWADAYKKATGIGLNYQSIGSGGGIKQITNKTVTFGASDMPLTPQDVAKNGFVQFPVINGAVVPVVNLDGIKPGELTLDGPTLAKIYMGEIKKWDDPAIKKLNPAVKLPSNAIAVVHRSDGSGTTFIWTNYLSKVSPDWKSKVGVNTAVEWPVGIGAKGNEGVANNTAQTKGSIGYVEYAYAKQNKMTYTHMINQAGKSVAPTSEAFQAAASGAKWGEAKDFYVILTNAPGDKAWPIAGSTFILMHTTPQNAEATTDAIKFFAWGYKNGKQMAADLDYVPMPDNVVALIEKTWKDRIKTSDGKPVY